MQQLTVWVSSHLVLDKSALPREMYQALRQALTFSNPEYSSRASMARSTFRVPSRISLLEESDNQVRIPRGALSMLQSLASKRTVQLKFVNQTTWLSVERLPESQLRIQLRDYQSTAAARLLDRVQGYICLPCGAGKTVLGCAAVVMSGQSAIVLVHTLDLAQQWAQTFSRLYGVHASTDHPPSRPLKPRQIAIFMIQALHKAGEAGNPSIKSAGCILLDECHHAPAKTFRDVFALSTARYRWGLTATPERSDGWGFMLPLVIGPQLFTMNTSDLLDSGHLEKPKIYALHSGVHISYENHTTRSGNLNMGSLVTALAQNESRNKLLETIAVHAAKRGRSVLVLVPRKSQAHALASRLVSAGIRSVALTSAVPKQKREQLLHKMRRKEVVVAFATQLADEGLDVPVLDTLVNANPGRAAGRAIQRIGRILRKSEHKAEPLLIDVIDGGLFRSQFNARRAAYRSQLKVDIHETVHADKLQQFLSRIM